MRYSNDEFNYVKITNEDESPNFEFGDTQKDETTSYHDNDDSLRDEVNDNPTTNSEKKPEEEQKKEKKQEKQEKQEKSEGDSSSSSGSHGFSASVSTIATVAGAALVAVPTLSALVGIDLYYHGKCNVTKLDTTETTLVYELELSDIGDDNCIIKLENPSIAYENEQDLKAGSNEGYFVDLTPDTNYRVSVIDVTYENFVLFTQDVVTLPSEVPPEPGPIDPDTPTEESVSVKNLVPWSDKIGVRLILDALEDNEYVATLSGEGMEDKNQALTDGKNSFYFTNLEATTEYNVEIKNKTTNISLFSEKITTIATDKAYPALDDVPDLEEGTFEVLLAYNYRDTNFDHFILTFEDSQGRSKQYSLENTDAYQSVTLNQPGDEFDFDFSNPGGFTYSISFWYNGETQHSDEYHIVFDTQSEVTKYTITYSAGSPSTEEPITTTLREGKALYLPECPFEAPDGYHFKCWRRKSSVVDYDPGDRATSSIDRDYEFVARFIDDTVINSIEFTNSIDFTAITHPLTFTMDYKDPEYDITGLKITFFNPDADLRAEGKNITKEFYATASQTVYVDDIAEMTLGTTDPLDYEIEYQLDSTYPEWYSFETSTVTFEDSEGRTANFNSFDFGAVTNETGYELNWTISYEDNFPSQLYQQMSFTFTPVGGGSVIEVPFNSMPESGIHSFNSGDGDFDFETGVYNYEVVVKNPNSCVIKVFRGLLDMAARYTRFNEIDFYAEYYTINERNYLLATFDVGDYDDYYGEVTLTLTQESNSSISKDIDIDKINGHQIIDITGYPTSALEDGDTLYSVTCAKQSEPLISNTPLDAFFEATTSTISEFSSYGMIYNNTVSEDNIHFDLGLLRINAASSSMKDLEVDIIYSGGTIEIPVPETVEFANGFDRHDIIVSDTFENYDLLLSVLRNYQVDIQLKYQVYIPFESDYETNTRSIRTGYTFSVK